MKSGTEFRTSAENAPTGSLFGVLAGGLIAGVLDLAFAISFAVYNGATPMRLLQVVASGAFGRGALEGGTVMALAGVAGHFSLALAWSFVYSRIGLLLWRVRPALAQRTYLLGIVYGVVVFFTMRLIVLPLSAYPFPVTFKPVATALDLMSHMFFVGIPIAFANRKRWH